MRSKRIIAMLCILALCLGLLAVTAAAASTPLSAPEVTISNVASTGKIKLTWNAVDGAASYQVYRADAKNGTYTRLKTLTGTTLTNTNAVAGKTYYYYVVAVAKDGSKSPKSAIKSRCCDLARPVISVGNVVSTGKNKVFWDAVEGATKYTLYIYDESGALIKTASTTKTSATHSTAEAGRVYTYKVRALCDVDAAASAVSAAKSRTCDLARPVISVALNTSGKPVITWNAVPGAAKYTIYIYNKDGELLKTASTSGTKITHSSAEAESTYTYRLSAIHTNSSANSAKSESVSACYSLSLDISSKTLNVGDTYQIPYTYTGSKTLTWTSDAESVVTVNAKGVVTAKKKGAAFIDVTDGTVSAYCEIVVKEPTVKATSIEVMKSDGPFSDGVTRYAGDNVWVVFRTDKNATNRKITASSSNTGVVSVSTSSNTNGASNAYAFVFNFKSAGSATITVKSEDGGVSYTYKLNIKSGYSCDHGDHTPEEWAACATNVACANGMKKNTSLGSWRSFSLSEDQLTKSKAIAIGQEFVHDYWRNGVRYCYFEYVGVDSNGKHQFYERWG